MIWTVVWIGLVIVGVAYFVVVAYDAKHSTQASPREDMFTCDKHGVFAQKYALRLTGITEEPIAYCPMCAEDRFKEAKKNVK